MELDSWLQQFGHADVAGAQEFFGLTPSGELDRATVRTLQAPRCGCSDAEQAGSALAKWPSNDIAYAFSDYLPESMLSKADQLAITRDNWDIVASICGLKAVLVDDIRDAHIVYDTGRGVRGGFDAPGVLAYAYLPSGVSLEYRNGGKQGPGLVVFDLDESWSKEKQASRRIAYWSVNWHEGCGHAAGLSHCKQQSDGENLMEPVYDPVVMQPGRWDREQLVLRYGPPRGSTKPTDPTAPPPTRPPAGGEYKIKVQIPGGEVLLFNAQRVAG